MEPLEPAAVELAQAALRELQFYGLCFALACASGLVRAHRDHRYRDCWNLLSTGLSAGFVGLACVALLAWVGGSRVGHEPGLIAAAIFVGLMGKEADQVYPRLIEWVLRRAGVELEDPHRHEANNPNLKPIPKTRRRSSRNPYEPPPPPDDHTV